MNLFCRCFSPHLSGSGSWALGKKPVTVVPAQPVRILIYSLYLLNIALFFGILQVFCMVETEKVSEIC